MKLRQSGLVFSSTLQNRGIDGVPLSVYADDAQNNFIGRPHEDGIAAIPFIPGSPADLSDGPIPEHGGFVPIEKMPQMPPKSSSGLPIGMTPGFNPNAAHPMGGSSGGAPSEPGFEDMLAGMMSQMGPQMTADWLGQAAAKSIVAGGCTGVMDSALNVLGVNNPLASGPLAGVLGAALQKAGVGELGSLMPGLGTALMGGSTAGLANAMGRQGVNSLLAATGLSDIPGASFLANAMGDEIGEQLQNMFTGGLDSLTGDLSDSLGDLSVDSLVADAENAINNIDVNALGSQGLDLAADQLMSEWKVDDESSAAEHIAQRALKENMEDLKGLAKDELLGGEGGGIAGLQAKIAKFFKGEAPGACLPVIRMGDLDDGADVSLMGVANILVEKQPVSRITDMVAGPKAPPPGKPILEGAATVLSAELPTAFVSSEVAVPSMMVKGAATVFLGGAIASIAPPKPKAPPTSSANDGPAGPSGPASTNSGSASEGAGQEGAPHNSDHVDEQKGQGGNGNIDVAPPSDPQQPLSLGDETPESREEPDTPALLGGQSSIAGAARELAPLALDSYEDGDEEGYAPPPGFEVLQRVDGTDGFQATVYKGEFQGQESIVVAYRGTAGMEDFKTDVAQAFKEHPQFTQAHALAEQIKTNNPNSNLVLTGHSLGGGLASYAGMMTTTPALVFNAAGPQPPTITAIENAGLEANAENIIHVNAKYDPLTRVPTEALLAIPKVGPFLYGTSVGAGIKNPGEPWGLHQYNVPPQTLGDRLNGHSMVGLNQALQNGAPLIPHPEQSVFTPPTPAPTPPPLTPIPPSPTDQQVIQWANKNNIPTAGLPIDMQNQIAAGS
ncbi:MAG: Mbeg1-like protein [Pirellulaceae bacterium]